MHLNIPSASVPSLARGRIATPEMLDVGKRNVGAARQWLHTIRASAATESFGEKLRRAVRARQAAVRSTTVKEADEQAERERARYRKLQRRQPTKGE